MGEISNKTILALLVATVVVSLGGAYISISAVNSRLSSVGLAPITGFAVVPNGTATVTVQTVSSIKFSDSSVAFGTGSVNTTGSYSNCSLSTVYTPYKGCVGFDDQINGFTVENDGNTNLSVELRSNISLATFIGTGGGDFRWNVSVNEAGSCVNKSGTDRTAVEPNTTDDGCGGDTSDCGAGWEQISTSNKNICPSLLFIDASDSLDIDINITIPLDAPVEAKIAGFIITGTGE